MQLVKVNKDNPYSYSYALPQELKEIFAKALSDAPETLGICIQAQWEDEDTGQRHSRTYWTALTLDWLEIQIIECAESRWYDAEFGLPDEWLQSDRSICVLTEVVHWINSFDNGDVWYTLQTESEYNEMLQERQRKRLELEVQKLLRKWNIPCINEEFLDQLQYNPLAYDKENYNERRAEVFGAGGMQALNDFTDAYHSYSQLFQEIEDWIAQNVPLLYARWRDKQGDTW